MAAVIRDVSQWFWDPEVWLPPNVTWDSFNHQQVIKDNILEPQDFAKFSDLWYPIPFAIVVIIVRSIVERKLFKPLGLRFGLKDHKRASPPHNQTLERAYRVFNKLSKDQTLELASTTGLTYIQVERWMRQRRQADLPNTLKKFCETGWRWMFYTCILVYGFFCLWSKPWFWNIRHCWYDYPYHQVDRDVWVYYMVELSFYWSLSISQFFDVKRKDFWEMFIHHNTTIALMMFSWTAHFTRIGTLVLIVHDCADHLLELAKLCRYVKYRKLCDAIFVLFSLTWIVTRCGIYPSWILYSTLLDASSFIQNFQMFPAYYIFNGLLGTLQILHILWTYFLIKAIHKALVKGGVDDQRSDSEPSDNDENDNNKKDE